ncbi:MAG: hypothetical protein JF610_14355 [Acidobacteria bacterium]|nr:hypothetical protein [Acidobacteriota bacterium]
MKRWIWTLAIAAVSLAAGCRPTPSPPPAASSHGRWQVVTFSPSEDTDVDGAILVDTQSGDSYVLCEYATAWCKLDRQQ